MAGITPSQAKNMFKVKEIAVEDNPIARGQIGYDNPRDNIDPKVKTNALITKEIVTNKFKMATSAGSSKVLTSDSSGNGTWQTVSGTSITSLNGLTGATQTFTNDTNVTITSSGTAHALGWSSTLAIARGGTNASAQLANRIVIVSGSTLVGTPDLYWDNTNSRLGIGTTSPFNSGKNITLDGIYFVRQAGATRYRGNWFMQSNRANFDSYDDTGAVYIPTLMTASNFDFRVGTSGTTLGHYIHSDGKNSIGSTDQDGRLYILEPTANDVVLNCSTKAVNTSLNPNFKIYQADYNTTDNSQVVMQTYRTTSSASNYYAYLLEARIVAIDTIGDAAGYIIQATYKNANTGATLVGAINADHTGENVGGWDATFITSGDDIQVAITGDIDYAVNWHCTLMVQVVHTAV
jgi:hypothetical protein